ncbi:MAG: hypothetical protein IIZ07_04825 [Ruminococcus sp.]|nr:hypothetical protein [Ruminococcus sp.]MEE0675713.1 septum formation initiator family protein [Ruminococcus sp.]MEE0856810.1 septum formation initiator family protein [Ruminococcus sp.]MEE1173029.1 septum formation initiator family protein [Ruminococcus sp.]
MKKNKTIDINAQAQNDAQTQNTADNGGLTELKPKKRKRKRRYFLLVVALVGFAFYAVITIIDQNVKIAEKRAELNELNQQISVVEIQTQHLQKVQGYEGEELAQYMEKIAKEELGYISDGERIFINVAGE